MQLYVMDSSSLLTKQTCPVFRVAELYFTPRDVTLFEELTRVWIICAL